MSALRLEADVGHGPELSNADRAVDRNSFSYAAEAVEPG
jgi:hypothetical protein